MKTKTVEEIHPLGTLIFEIYNNQPFLDFSAQEELQLFFTCFAP